MVLLLAKHEWMGWMGFIGGIEITMNASFCHSASALKRKKFHWHHTFSWATTKLAATHERSRFRSFYEFPEKTGDRVHQSNNEHTHIRMNLPKVFFFPFACCFRIARTNGHNHFPRLFLSNQRIYNIVDSGFKWISFYRLSFFGVEMNIRTLGSTLSFHFLWTTAGTGYFFFPFFFFFCVGKLVNGTTYTFMPRSHWIMKSNSISEHTTTLDQSLMIQTKSVLAPKQKRLSIVTGMNTEMFKISPDSKSFDKSPF